MLVGCSLLRCVLLLVQSTMCFLTRATQLCLASLPAPSASSPEPRSIRYFWVRSGFVQKLALSFIFHFTMFDSSHWPWVLVGNVGKSERLTVAARFPSISRHDVDQAALTRTSVRKILVFFLRNFSFSPCPSMSIGIDRDALAVSGVNWNSTLAELNQFPGSVSPSPTSVLSRFCSILWRSRKLKSHQFPEYVSQHRLRFFPTPAP